MAVYFYHVCNDYSLDYIGTEFPSNDSLSAYKWRSGSNDLGNCEIGTHIKQNEVHYFKSDRDDLQNVIIF